MTTTQHKKELLQLAGEFAVLSVMARRENVLGPPFMQCVSIEVACSRAIGEITAMLEALES